MPSTRTPTTCPYCGNTNHYAENQTAYLCIHCATVVQLTTFQREGNLPHMNAILQNAVDLQISRRFEEAEKMYRGILLLGHEDPEIYWRILMCQYCIEYQEDENGRLIPFILYPDLEPLHRKPEYAHLFECTKSTEQADYYRQLTNAVETILSKYRDLRHTVQYDVFISVKQSRPDGGYTLDSEKASDLYDYLTAKGLRVFNSRRTPIPAGHEYEPYIISALISSKVMIVVGSTPDNMNARWVKNEWSRFQWLQHHEKEPRLLFCYLTNNMLPKSIPQELNPDREAILDGIHAQTKLDLTLDSIFADKKKHEMPPQPNKSASGNNKLLKYGFGFACILVVVLLFTLLLRPNSGREPSRQPAEQAAAFANTSTAVPTTYETTTLPSTELPPTDSPTPSPSPSPTPARDHSEVLAERLLHYPGAVSAGFDHTVGLMPDGTVIAAGSNKDGQCNVNGWRNIIQVAAGHGHTLGLKADGSVVATGDNDEKECDVSDWSNIVQIAAGSDHSVGLRSDGTVVATGWDYDGQCFVYSWTDIVQVAAGGSHTVGLKADGTVVAVGDNDDNQCDVTEWTDIVQISAGSAHTVGLKSDGTVVAVGYSPLTLGGGGTKRCDVESWTSIVQISAGGRDTVGVKADGSVVAVGWHYKDWNVRNFGGVKQISAGWSHVVCFDQNGRVMSLGSNDDNQRNVDSWRLKTD